MGAHDLAAEQELTRCLSVWQLEAATATLAEIQAVCNEKIKFEMLMTKKNGKDGQKGSSERWFALTAEGTLDYYDPKKVCGLSDRC